MASVIRGNDNFDSANVPLRGVGDGQSWALVSHTVGTIYYNTSGRPFVINANVAQSGSTPGVSVDGLAIGQSTTVNGYSNVQSVTAIIPNGSSYYVYGGINSVYKLS